MAEIIGGIDALAGENVDTIVSGGNPIVVGNNALDAMRDRAIYLKDDLSSFDNKKLLAIIGMSQPIAFGVVSYDDGETSFIVSSKKSRTSPSEELVRDLSARISMDPARVAEWLIVYLNLDQPLWLAMGDFVDRIVRQIDSSLVARGKKPLGVLRVDTNLGCLIPFTTCGKLEISPKPEIDAKTFKEFASYMLDLCVAKKCIDPAARAEEKKISIPARPKLEDSVIASMSEPSAEQKTVSDYVRAIIIRENQLTPFLVSIEKYNVAVAREIQEYTTRILGCFATSAETQ